LLKNAVKRSSIVPNSSESEYVAEIVPQACLGDANKLIRHTAAHVLASLVAKSPAILVAPYVGRTTTLSEYLETCARNYANDPLRADGAVQALLFMAEDAKSALDSDDTGRPVARLIPLWIDMCTHPEPKFRERALDSIACFTIPWTQSLEINVDTYLSQLAKLQNDPDPRIRKRVLQALGNFVQYFPQRVNAEMFTSMVMFALQTVANNGESEDVVREGCEFFESALQGKEEFTPLLNPLLPTLIPLLVHKMTYTQDDLYELEDQCKNDASIADRLDEIRPISFGGFGGGGNASATSSSGRVFQGSMPEDATNDATNTDDDESDNESTRNMHNQEAIWTTRRISCSVLETLARRVEPIDGFMQLFLGVVSTGLESKSFSWTVRESAIMALGALGGVDRCVQELKPHLPKLFPYLVSQGSASEHVLIRKCAVWTLGRFASPLVNLSGVEVFRSALGMLLERSLDANKGVQFAALCALAEVFESCQNEIGENLLVPLLKPLLEKLTEAIDLLQVNNQYYLFDAMASLFRCASLGRYLKSTELMKVFMPRIWTRFENSSPTDPNLGAITWFLAQACHTLEESFFPFAEFSLMRCGDFIEEGISLAHSAMEIGEPLGEGDLEFVAGALQLTSSIVSAVKSEFSKAGTNASRAVQLSFRCVTELQDIDVRRDALGVIGDVIVFCPTAILNETHNGRAAAHLWEVCLSVAEDVDSARLGPDVTRNAIWVLSELAPRVSAIDDDTFARTVRLSFAYVLLREDAEEFAYELEETCAFLAARLMLCDTADRFVTVFDTVGNRADHPGLAFRYWCKIVFKMSDNDSGREDSVRGWVRFVERSLIKYGVPAAPIVLSVLARLDFRKSSPELHRAIKAMLEKLRVAHTSDQEWMKKINALPGTTSRARLQEIYA